jgi:uncharacterized membrane protein YdbT with pleckstrin-like domain
VNMKSSEILSEKPCARALIVYYGVALSIICLSGIGVIASWAWREEGAVDFRVPLIGLVGGVCILAFIGYIHLEMISAVYVITETSAHARWGLLVKHDESIQLGAVRSIKVSQGLVQRLFKLGDVILYTTSSDILVLRDLDHPTEKKETIWELVQNEAAKRKPHYVSDR